MENNKLDTLPSTENSITAGFQVPIEILQCEFGKGIFFTTDIPCGTLLWKCRDLQYTRAAAFAKVLGCDLKEATKRMGYNVISYFTESEMLARLSELEVQGGYELKKFWMDHVYVDEGRLNEILDGAEMVNHSETPTAS